MINYTEQVMPVRIFGLFGLHHGLEIELKSKVKESIQEEAFLTIIIAVTKFRVTH